MGCASPGAPPGGPPDEDPPQLLRVRPDTNAVGQRPDHMELRFDEVVSETPRGANNLGDLFLISPRDGDPRVRWKRSRIELGPRRGWRANTTYTVTMLPGLSDLRGNADSASRTFVFSTGPTMPPTRLSGVVFDWVGSRVAPGAFVEAIALPDSVAYVTVADSVGRFTLRHLPAGRYLLRAIVDQNRNRGLDPRELFDSATVSLTDTLTREILAFVHDSVGPSISGITERDSVTLRVSFDKAIDTAQRISPALFTLKRADSSVVQIATAVSGRDFDKAVEDSTRRKVVEDSVRRVAVADSARRADSVRADSAGRPIPRQPARVPPRAAADTATRREPPKPRVPPPYTDVVLRLAAPLERGTSHRLRADSIRSLLRIARSSERVFTTAKASPARDSIPPARRDSGNTQPPARRPPDSARPRGQ